MNSKVVAIIVVVVIVLAGGWWAFAHNNPDTTPASTDQNETSNTSPSNDSSSTNQSTPVAATIIYTNNGFEPKQTMVKSGDTVRITNSSQNALSLDSDPHPTHTIQPELNVGDVEPGQSKTFVIDKVGTWGFHNHENPSNTGSITVQ